MCDMGESENEHGVWNLSHGSEEKAQNKPSRPLTRLRLDGERSPTGLCFGVPINHVSVINGALHPTARSQRSVTLSPVCWSVETASTSTCQMYNLLPSCYKERHATFSIKETPPRPSIPNRSCFLRGQNPLYCLFSLLHPYLTWLFSISIERWQTLHLKEQTPNRISS